jgi:Zinc carboxypeptidase
MVCCSIGKSNKLRDLWVLKLGSTSGPNTLKMKMIAGLHGSDVTGQAILLQFAWNLCHNSKNDYFIQQVSETFVTRFSFHHFIDITTSDLINAKTC